VVHLDAERTIHPTREGDWFRKETPQPVSLAFLSLRTTLSLTLLYPHRFLGEQFNGQWNNGELVLHSEQVSHHPPVTAYYLENASKGVSLEGNCAQKTTFSARTLSIRQVGHGIVRVKLADGTVECESP
jgi:hypothetical protein